MRRFFAATVAVLLALLIPATPAQAVDPIRILVLGDSISELDDDHNGSNEPELDWQTHLSDLLTEAGVPHQIVTYAVGGRSCAQWLAQTGSNSVQSIVAAQDPNVTFLFCGTNDAGNTSGIDSTIGTLFTRILQGHPSGRILANWVQYSASRPANAAALRNGEAAVNDAFYRQIYVSNPHGSKIIGAADFQRIPEMYLDSGGIHPTEAGYEVMARIIYDRLRVDAAYSSWPDVAPDTCGLTGHRPGGSPESGYLPCTGLATP